MRKLTFLLTTLCALQISPLFAAKKVVLDAKIEDAIVRFYEQTSAGERLAEKAMGMLVFPSVGKAGLGLGAEYGEGALLIDGVIAQYYSTASASIGFQAGVQSRSQVILFLDEKALRKFQIRDGWEVGVDGSVAIANIGAGGEIDTKTLNEPVVGFVFGNKGLMYNLSLEGSKISRITKE